jgi:hypothetical protein
MQHFKTPTELITTAQLAALTAGGDDYIRTKGNEVLGLALRLDKNPKAPDVVAFGKGPRIVARAHRLFESGVTVPAFVKRGTNAWEYLGQYRATAIRSDALSIRRYASDRPRGSVAGVLFLEGTQEPQVRISGGGFADPETRREIEHAAIGFVTRQLESQGFKVHDRQRENCGYDLLAEAKDQQFLVEVKGTDSVSPRFFLSRNEWRCSQSNADWRLYVVCEARTVPALHMFTSSEIMAQFILDPLVWECTTIPSN